MSLVKNNLFSLYDIEFHAKIIACRLIDLLKKNARLKSAFVTLLIFLPFLSGCGSAFVTSRQDDVITQIDVWSAENEYAKAFATLDYVKTSHPQYQKLQVRKSTLFKQAAEYEQRIEKQIMQLIKTNQWAQALDLLDEAKNKYPLTINKNKERWLGKTEKKLFQEQQQLLLLIEQKIMLQRSLWMIKTRPVYQEKLNTDPRNKSLQKQLENLNNESQILAQKLTRLSKEAIDKKHYKTAAIRIKQAIALAPDKERRQILSQLQSRAKKSYQRKQQTQSRTHMKEQNTLLEDIEKSFIAGDLLTAKQLILKLDDNDQEDSQIIQLKEDVDNSIDYTIAYLVAEANKNYTDGQFHQAIELWQQVMMYDPQNSLAKTNILRAEEVINKLTRLREKQ